MTPFVTDVEAASNPNAMAIFRILLDVTRLVSRLGQGPLTGIDRVEAAWLAAILADDVPRARGPHGLLARIRGRQVLLPVSAGEALLRWLSGDETGLAGPDWLDRLRGRRDLRAGAEAGLRRMALWRGGKGGAGIKRALTRLADIAPHRWVYLNVGHTNLTAPLWRSLGFARRVFLVHDTIPLDHPEYTRAGQSTAFATRLTAGMANADVIIAISRTTADSVVRWRSRLGVTHAAPVVVAPIGTRLATPCPHDLPPGIDLTTPYFLTLGTIEPRKNHDLLLDAWALIPEPVPRLYIVGRRGWAGADTLARLDALPPGGAVRELSGLSDGAVAALMTGARALLMPSRAEGFGLPVTEAAARGVPVIAAPLPSVAELLGETVTTLSPDDPTAWAGLIAELAQISTKRSNPRAVPTWPSHFAAVMNATD